jgi:hypothetical protein
LEIEEIDRAIELEENAPQRFYFLVQRGGKIEGLFRDSPLVGGEEAFPPEGIPDSMRINHRVRSVFRKGVTLTRPAEG